ncbi:MAG: hypothetical protein WCK05_04445 [Planctomycetota bacterium]
MTKTTRKNAISGGGFLLMGEIDKVIDAHGGWPGAFITDPKILEGLKQKKP